MSSALPLPTRLQLCWRLLAVTALSLGATALQAEKLVVGIGSADPLYVEARQTPNGLRRETYVFMPGNFLPGMTHDRSLDRMSFHSIATMLATDLQRQNYHPAGSSQTADLLLVVHWGVTSRIDQDIENNLTNLNSLNELGEQYVQSLQNDTDVLSGAGSVSEVTGVLMGMGSGQRSDLEMQAAHESLSHRGNQSTFHTVGRDNAAILGLTNALSAESNQILYSDRHRVLHTMTQEERYFIVVMAYDLPGLLKQGKLRRLWTARASIRSAGVNFGQAVDRISQVAGSFFGRRTDDVVMTQSGIREGKVEVGELQIIGANSPKK